MLSAAEEERFMHDLSVPFHHIYTFPNGNSLYLGSQLAVAGWPDRWNYTEKDDEVAKATLLASNIKSVVCCAELYDPWKSDIEFLHIPMQSGDDADIAPACLKGWDFITQKLNTGSVLVHCNCGIHRSATVVIGYLAKYQNMTIEESYKFVRSKRLCINIDNFVPKLQDLM